MTAIEYLDQQVKQIAPLADGVSIGRWDTVSTWRATGTVTSEQRQLIDVLFKTFDKSTFDASQVPSDLDARITALETRMSVTELTVSEISLPKIG